eukprot:1070360-Prorocentrum_minimum.AAC.1
MGTEVTNLLTQAGYQLAQGREGVFVPKTTFREYATAMITFAPGEAVAIASLPWASWYPAWVKRLVTSVVLEMGTESWRI